MKRGDASFTFLSRVQEIEWNVQDKRWQSALALALTIPDICGGIEYPELVKKYRDGRVMEDRKGEPARDVGSQYIRWFNHFAAEYFKRNETDESPYLTGERCWQLRCEYLHQNKGFSNEDREDTYFHLGINCGTSVCMQDQDKEKLKSGHIRLDIQQLCIRMCLAARAYYEKNYDKKNFSMYHTPVLDFVQWANRGEEVKKTIVIVCEDREYAQAVQTALKQISGLIEIFRNPQGAKSYLGKKRPALWVITEQMTEQNIQPWKIDSVPVIVLSETESSHEEGKYLWISVPFQIDTLRESVRKRLT